MSVGFSFVRFLRGMLLSAQEMASGATVHMRRIIFALLVVFFAGSATPVLSQRGRGGVPAEPSEPTPHYADGRPIMGPLPGEKGLWVGNGGRLAINPNNYEARTTLGAPIHIDDVPLKDWARAIVDDRHLTFLSYEPHARCKPSGGAREFVTPYGLEIVDLPALDRIYIFDIGGPHTYRIIYMDGREHPENWTPSYYGHSVGHWEGDTLVVDSVGFNERFWMNRDGIPHTDRLHLIERLTRTDFDTLQYDITIDDPGAYDGIWESGFAIRWTPDREIFEYICQDNNTFPSNIINAFGEAEVPYRVVP
jgi:hypothetical protein